MILAIDCGSTSFKFGLFDSSLQSIAATSQKLRYNFSPGGGVELEPESIHQAIQKGLATLKIKTRRITAIAITSQAQTFTVVDQQGQATRRFISWQDSRATNACRKLNPKLSGFGNHCSFGEILPALQLCQIKHCPVVKNQMVLNLPSYLVRLWSGESVIDNNLAAMSGLYSLQLRGWWPRALKECALTTSQLPRIIPIGSMAATTNSAARLFGLSAGIPIILAGNDQTAAAFDAQLHRRRALLITLGTAQVAYVCSKHLSPSHLDLVRGPYSNGWFYRMAADSAGGNIVNWVQTILKGCGNDRQFFAQAARSQYELNFDASLDTSRGGWNGIGFHHTSADLAHSILVTLSKRMNDMIGKLGIRPSNYQILVIGGGSHQPFWIDLLSQTLKTKITRIEASAVSGAARMAADFLKSSHSPE